MPGRPIIIQILATAIASSRWEERAIIDRCVSLFGREFRWIAPLARRILASFPEAPRPRVQEIGEWLSRDRQIAKVRLSPKVLQIHTLSPPEMRSSLRVSVEVPTICSTSELADWLSTTTGELDWFANRKNWNRSPGSAKLDHYHYRLLSKRFCSVRLIESPKSRLKAMQRQVLQRILHRIPIHEAAHGFVPGRSIHSFVAPHVGQAVVARMDLCNFFTSVSVAQVGAVFSTIGYPEAVASAIAGVCTNATPSWVWDKARQLLLAKHLRSIPWLCAVPHLPQGAPTSPSLANLCAFRLDCRVAALARSAGAIYTRYADDLAFSGDRDFARRVKRFLLHVGATAAEEGFKVHHRKTRIMHASIQQHLAGIVVNKRPNIRRRDYDRLKAILVNCVRHGPASQNRDHHSEFRCHLAGRISFVEQVHAERGRRLREIYERIAW